LGRSRLSPRGYAAYGLIQLKRLVRHRLQQSSRQHVACPRFHNPWQAALQHRYRPNSKRRSGRITRKVQSTVFPHRQSRCDFPRQHQQREIPRMICPTAKRLCWSQLDSISLGHALRDSRNAVAPSATSHRGFADGLPLTSVSSTAKAAVFLQQPRKVTGTAHARVPPTLAPLWLRLRCSSDGGVARLTGLRQRRAHSVGGCGFRHPRVRR